MTYDQPWSTGALVKQSPPFKIKVQPKINRMFQNIHQYTTNQRENSRLLQGFYASNFMLLGALKQSPPTTSSNDKSTFFQYKVKKINRDNKVIREKLCKIKNRNQKQINKAKAKCLKCQIGKFKLPTEILKKYNGTVDIPEEPCRQFKLFRPSIFMDLEAINERPLGRLTFQLYAEAFPMIVLHLIRYFAKQNCKALRFPRIYGPLWAECEIPVDTSSSENFDTKEYDFRALDNGEGPGIISFDLKDLKLLKQGFLLLAISFKPLSKVNEKRIAIGRIINGRKNLFGLSEYGTRNGITPKRIAATKIGLDQI